MKRTVFFLLSLLVVAVVTAEERSTPSVRMRVLAERVQTIGGGLPKEKSLAAMQEFLAPYRAEIVSVARGTDPRSRVMAVYLLGLTAPDAEVLGVLVSAAREGDAQVQELALSALAANRSNLDVVAVREALMEPIVDKRSVRSYRAASFAAAFLRLPEAVPVIAADLRTADAQVKQAALSALREYGPAARSALPALQEQLHAARDQDSASALREVIRRVETPQ